MEFESYSTFKPVDNEAMTLDICVEELDAILEGDVVNTVPPDLNDTTGG